ncbi:MAG TPA: FMN-binding protein [Spirochaetia bacterium]|nr:FMN-binding protein [Spirochaetia bacterium]
MKKMVVVLTVVMVLAGLILASAYTVFQPAIARNQAQALSDSLASLFQGTEKLTFDRLKTDKMEIYSAMSGAGKLAGYAVRVVGSGYGGPIQMLVGVSPDLKTIVGLQVVENIETPGLGGRITEDAFRNQFQGLDPAKEITYVKNQQPDKNKNQIEAITGSTISSRAVTTALSGTLEEALAVIKEVGASTAAK